MTAPYPVSKPASLPDFQNGNDTSFIFWFGLCRPWRNRLNIWSNIDTDP